MLLKKRRRRLRELLLRLLRDLRYLREEVDAMRAENRALRAEVNRAADTARSVKRLQVVQEQRLHRVESNQ